MSTTVTDAPFPVGAPKMQNYRKTRRYLLNVPVYLSWLDSDNNLRESEAVTRDISPKGIFILTADVPGINSYIEVDAYMPALSGRTKALKLHGEGRVLRIERQSATGSGFAAELLFQPEPQDTALDRTVFGRTALACTTIQ